MPALIRFDQVSVTGHNNKTVLSDVKCYYPNRCEPDASLSGKHRSKVFLFQHHFYVGLDVEIERVPLWQLQIELRIQVYF